MDNGEAIQRAVRALARAVDGRRRHHVLELAEKLGLGADVIGILRATRPKNVGETVDEWLDAYGWPTPDGYPPDDPKKREPVESLAQSVREAIDRAVEAFDARDTAGVIEALEEAARIESDSGGTPSTDRAAAALLRRGWGFRGHTIEYQG